MSKREYDLVIFGATGYTGEHVARALQAVSASSGDWPDVRWAIAGRSAGKLEAIVAKHGLTPTGTIVADVSDETSLRVMASRASIVMNATGPYRFYGESVVTACIASGADYVDLCGEPEFIDRCLLKHADAAKAANVFIVHSCAFDSVPADIGCLFTALQFPPPGLCAHADMYHTVAVDGPSDGALGHATTFYAAVHGFGSVKQTRAQRKQLLAKIESESPGASKGPAPLGPRLRVHPGPTYKKEIGKYAFLFPGSDVAVVRTSQRALAMQAPQRAASAPYLTPQFGASFCIASAWSIPKVALAGMAFSLLSGYAWGRSILLKHPELFTLGTFSDAGPTEDTLQRTSWRTIFLGKGWATADPGTPPETTFDTHVTVSVSGPEPGYIATSRMFLAMARSVLHDRATYGVRGGVFTPGGLAGSGGELAIRQLVARFSSVGIAFAVEEKKSVTPRPIPKKGEGAATKRPAWQTALNAVALSGWLAILLYLVLSWPDVHTSSGTSLLQAVFTLELICAFEVLQIVLGIARGDVATGVVLHAIRFMQTFVVLPALPHHLASRVILVGWAITEVGRYPMFLFPNSKPVRLLRYLTPLVTFPLASGTEAWAAYLSLPLLTASSLSVRMGVRIVILINCTIGPAIGYTGIVKRAMKALKGGA